MNSLKNSCEKMKQCAKAQVSDEDMQNIPEAMREMMEKTLDNMCVGMIDEYNKAVIKNELRQPALACYQSINNKSCEAMQDETPECRRFGKLAEKYGH
ncbi:MAG: hypothetical protein JKY53_12855 [Flavobacteriales bacterium]|nr:hypothetical protein [Flavobacteriales bacterium]